MKVGAISLFIVAAIGVAAIGVFGAIGLSSSSTPKTAPDRATAHDPNKLFVALVQSLNYGDVSAAVELFSEEAVLEPRIPGSNGRCPKSRCVGRIAIQGELQGQVSEEQEIRLITGFVLMNEMSGRYVLRNAATKGSDFDRLVFRFRLEERDGLISFYTFDPDLTDGLTLSFFDATMHEPATPHPCNTDDPGLVVCR